MHVLVIEDNFMISLSIRAILSEFDFDSVATARSEAAAIEAAYIQPPDLITCDVDLDPGNGLDAITAITAQRMTRVIFITSSADLVRDRYPGATVLQKPFCQEEMTEVVRSTLNQSIAPLY
jgi:two-component system, response regulator PdtaR